MRSDSIPFGAVLASLALLLLFAGPFSRVGAEAAQSGCALSSATVPLGEGTVHYDRAGRGNPVILLHGLFAQKEQWRGMLCDLASAGFDAIAPDLPGFGQSQGYPVTVYDLDTQANLLARFASTLGVEGFDLAGNSMGGTIAALFVEQYPEKVRRLAFIGPPLGAEAWGPGVRRAIIQGVNPFIPTDHVQLDLEMALLFAQPPSVSDAVRASIIRDYVTRHHHYQQVWNIVNLFDTVLQGISGEPLEIRVPVLILWGELDAVYPVSGAESLRKRLPGSRLVTLSETGHLPMVERPTETGKLLVQFLREDTRPGSPPHRQDR